MKWIQWVLLKIQSRHDSVHRRTDGQTDGRTDGQTDKVIPVYPPFNFVEAGGIIKLPCCTVDYRYLAPVGSQNSRARVKWFSRYLTRTRDFQDQSPTLWRLHLLNPNSMLSDNGCTYISRISADVDIAPATNHNKPYYILIIMHQKLSNYTLHKAA